jgi:putative transposase
MPVNAGTTYMQTHRTVEGRYYMVPTKEVAQIQEYCLAVAAKRYGVDVHGYNFNSNHDHEVTTDHAEEEPAFRQYLHALIARAVNQKLGRQGTFWDPAARDTRVLAGPEEMLDSLAYTLANPVKHGLVSRADRWPGARTTVGDIGRTRVIKRPAGFFHDGILPDSVELSIVPLPFMAHLPLEVVRQRVGQAVARKEQSFREARRNEGKGFLGRRRVLRQSPLGCPREAPQPRPRERFKCFSPLKLQALQGELIAFQEAHEAARLRVRAGDRTPGFPEGTYRWRQQLWPAACPRRDLDLPNTS